MQTRNVFTMFPNVVKTYCFSKICKNIQFLQRLSNGAKTYCVYNVFKRCKNILPLQHFQTLQSHIVFVFTTFDKRCKSNMSLQRLSNVVMASCAYRFIIYNTTLATRCANILFLQQFQTLQKHIVFTTFAKRCKTIGF